MNKGRKITGGRYVSNREKKLHEKPGQPRVVKLGQGKKKNLRTRGGNQKTVLLTAKEMNLQDGKGKSNKVEITNVIETPSNRFLARQNILTKGTIVETSKGNAKITNRPTQEGCVNGILIKE